MFGLVPFGKRREDAFSQLAKSFNDAFNDELEYLIEAELPGFRKEEIDIDYASPYLTIKAVRNEENNEENEQHQVVRRERRYGEFVRRFYVQDVDEAGIEASMKDGVLSLKVPKLQKPQTNRIEITDGKEAT